MIYLKYNQFYFPNEKIKPLVLIDIACEKISFTNEKEYTKLTTERGAIDRFCKVTVWVSGSSG